MSSHAIFRSDPLYSHAIKVSSGRQDSISGYSNAAHLSEATPRLSSALSRDSILSYKEDNRIGLADF